MGICGLGEKSYISHVSLVWEASYASLYEIQVSDNGKSWTTLKTVNGLGGTESIDLNCEARYIKMNGLQRATSYGFLCMNLKYMEFRHL